MYETYYDKLQKDFGQDVIQLHNHTDAFVINVRTTDILNDSDKVQDQYKMFDFSNLDKEHKLFSIELKKVPG